MYHARAGQRKSKEARATSGAQQTTSEPVRRESLPLFGEHKLGLGLFGTNASHGTMMSAAPSSYDVNWEHTKAVAQLADRVGLDVLMPIARWRGLGGATDFNGTSYESFTWAAALSQVTEQITLFASAHPPTMHPIVAAKEAVTVEHAAHGRFGLNAIVGWYATELEMFGARARDHDERYRLGAEWIEICRRLWREETFDWDSEYFHLRCAQAHPGSLRETGPVLVSAGNSAAGQAFSAKYCDFNVITFGTLEEGRQIARNVRRMAREEHGRDIGILTHGYLICRDTEAEATRARDILMEHADWSAANGMMAARAIDTDAFGGHVEALRERFVLGWGGYPFVGSPEQVIETLAAASAAGIDGVLFGLLDPAEELAYLGEALMPLLHEAELRAA